MVLIVHCIIPYINVELRMNDAIHFFIIYFFKTSPTFLKNKVEHEVKEML